MGILNLLVNAVAGTYGFGMPSWGPPNKQYLPPKRGEPALHLAARVGDQTEIRALVEQGADLDALFELQLDPGARREPATPLAMAAGSGDGASADTVTLLLELGASIEVSDGVSPLPYSCGGLGWNYPPVERRD